MIEKRPPFDASVVTLASPMSALGRMNFASIAGSSHALNTFSRGAAILRFTVSSRSFIVSVIVLAFRNEQVFQRRKAQVPDRLQLAEPFFRKPQRLQFRRDEMFAPGGPAGDESRLL